MSMADVFQLAPHDNRPLRVRHVMHDDPEKTAGQSVKKKAKAKSHEKLNCCGERKAPTTQSHQT